jgi:hypothetical protein
MVKHTDRELYDRNNEAFENANLAVIWYFGAQILTGFKIIGVYQLLLLHMSLPVLGMITQKMCQMAV